MTNACAGSLVNLITRQGRAHLRQIPSTSHAWTKHATSSRNAFYARFYTIATRSLHQDSRINGCSPLPDGQDARHLRPSYRYLSTSASCLRRVPRGAQPAKPRRQTPQVRIPFDLFSDAKLQSIFKQEIGEDQGNQVLRTLHTRRVNGSLVDVGTHIEDVPDLPQEAYENALGWLREKYPVDEQAAANVWLGRELSKVEKSYIERAERLGLYKRVDQDEDSQAQERSTSDTSTSVLEQFQNYHKKRRAKEAAEEEARKQTPEYKAQEEVRLARIEEKQSQELVWQEKLRERKAKFEKEAKVTDFEDPPEMSSLQRLAPATLFGLMVLVACYWYSQNYQPPSEDKRLYPRVPVSVATIGGIIALNVSITALWRFPVLQKTFNKFLLAVPAYPFAVSMLGNIISHQTWRHLASNMTVLTLFGVSLHEEIGRANFMSLYVSGGVVGSVCSLWYFVLTKTLNTSHCGASGCTWAVLAAWSYLTSTNPPRSTESWDFAFDVGRYILVVTQILNHFGSGVLSRVDVFAHIAGALTGLSIGYTLRQNSIPARLSQKQIEAAEAEERLRKQQEEKEQAGSAIGQLNEEIERSVVRASDASKSWYSKLTAWLK